MKCTRISFLPNKSVLLASYSSSVSDIFFLQPPRGNLICSDSFITLTKTIPPNQTPVLNSKLSEHFTEYSTSFPMRSKNPTPDSDFYICAYVTMSTTIAPNSPAYTQSPQHPRSLSAPITLTGSEKGSEGYRLSPPTPP